MATTFSNRLFILFRSLKFKFGDYRQLVIKTIELLLRGMYFHNIYTLLSWRKDLAFFPVFFSSFFVKVTIGKI
jgi:hypothetical protein